MERILKIRFTAKAIFSIVLIYSVVTCCIWVTQEWKANSAPLPQTKIVEPWTFSSHETPILTNSKSVKWQSPTPPSAVYNKESFLQKNIGEVVLHYTLNHDLTECALIYYGKTNGGNLIFYKELFDSGDFTHGSNYWWRVRVNNKKNIIEFFTVTHRNYLLDLSIACMFFLLLLSGLFLSSFARSSK